MELKQVKNIKPEKVTMYGSSGTTIQWLWSKEEAPHFALRRFVIAPGGEIGIHSHLEEHEIFVLSGEGTVFNDSGVEFHIQPEDTLFVPSNEPHGYRNASQKNLVFLCIIPVL